MKNRPLWLLMPQPGIERRGNQLALMATRHLLDLSDRFEHFSDLCRLRSLAPGSMLVTDRRDDFFSAKILCVGFFFSVCLYSIFFFSSFSFMTKTVQKRPGRRISMQLVLLEYLSFIIMIAIIAIITIIKTMKYLSAESERCQQDLLLY